MRRAIDLTGQRFGRLKVLEKAGQLPTGKTKTLRNYWYCECECGNWTLTSTRNLRNGSTVSCGCRKTELLNKYIKSEEIVHPRLTHGHTTNGICTSEYDTWRQMKRTCSHVCEWNDYSKFLEDVGVRPSSEHQLARLDVREPHGPLNTYWRHKDERKSITYNDIVDEFSIDIDSFIGATTYTEPTPADAEREGAPGGVDWEHAEERNRTTATRKELANISR